MLNCHQKRGFTLIELLVVISIIALLLSILMPSLQKAKEMTKKVACLSNLHQWGLIFNMATVDNDDRFWQGIGGQDGRGHWMSAVRDYYQDPEIRLCPSASNINRPSSRDGLVSHFDRYGVWGPWGRDPWGPVAPWQTEGDAGSYALNTWIEDYKYTGTPHHPHENFWRTSSQKGASNIPTMVDSIWLDGWVLHTDSVYWAPGGQDGGNVSSMQRYFINRHNMAVNAGLMDLSCRTVPLKQMYKLKWNRNFDPNA